MKRLKDCKGSTFEWIQPKWTHRYHELRAGGDVYATLAWQKIMGSLALVDSSEGRYTLKRGGFMHPYVTVREEGSLDDLAVFHLGLLGNGALEFKDGRKFLSHRMRFWGYYWAFYDEYERLQFTMKKRSTMKHRADVLLDRDVRRDRYLLISLAVGWYAMVIASEEAASAAAIAGAGSS